MSGFTKLDSALTASSIWNEPDSVRIVWVTMLSLADKDGNVKGSVVGLAHLARKTIPETRAALDILEAPDPYSGRREQEGRRVVAFEGGWHLVNHAFYREHGMSEEQKDRSRSKTRERVKRYRALHNVTSASASGDVSASGKGDARGKAVALPTALDTEPFRAAWGDWQAHRREIKKPLTATSIKSQLAQFEEWGERRAIAAIRHTIRKGWQGLREDDAKNGSTPVRREKIDVPITRR